MKKLLLAIFLFANIAMAKAQGAQESTIEINKIKQACALATYNINPDLLEEAFKRRMNTEGLGSGDKSKGFRVYKKVMYKAFGDTECDIYVKIDGKKETSSALVAVSRGYDNFVSGATDEKAMQNMIAFLNGMPEIATAIQLEKDIESGEDALKKADKKYNNSISDGKDLEADKLKLERKIEDNKKEQADLLKAKDDAKAKLDELKAKRK